jgi:hypothetical protein
VAEIPDIFNQPGAAFVFLPAGIKFPPIEKEWQNKPHTFTRAWAHVGNVGILAGNGFIGLDQDDPSAFDGLELPISTKWETRPGRFGMWFKAADVPAALESIGKKPEQAQLKLFKDGKPCGEVKLQRTYQAIPPSWKTLEDGTRADYKLLSSGPPAEISMVKLLADLQARGITFSSKLEANAARLEEMGKKANQKRTESDEARTRRYAEAALRDEVLTLAGSPAGNRNDQLNRSAFAMGQFVAAKVLSEDEVISELSRAATNTGLASDEIRKTIMSGLESGNKHPRLIPEKSRANSTGPKADRSILEDLSEKMKDDPGIIYEPEYFQILTKIYNTDPKEWVRIKKIFLTRKVSVRDFIKEIKEAEEDTPIIETPFIILEGGKLAEMVARDGKAKFAVYDPMAQAVEYVPEILQNGTRIIPPTSDEIFQKGYVTLPSEAEEYGTELDLYREIQMFVHTYLEVSPDYESIAAFYPMLTWVHDVMPVVAYLRAKGDWGVGKSRYLDVFRALCYRSISTTGAMSEAPIFRIMDRWKGTLIIDEGDFGKSRDSTAAMEKILVCGFERGKPIIRCNPNDPAEVNFFDPFGPKIIATRYGFRDKALESRCFTEIMKESIRTDVPIQLPYEFEEEARHLRNKLLMYRFRNRELVKQTSDKGQIKIDLSGLPKRIQQAARPLSVILANYPELLVTLKTFLEVKSKALVVEASETTEGYLVRVMESQPKLTKDEKIITWDAGFGGVTELVKAVSGNHKLTMQQVISKANSLGFKTEKSMIAGEQKRRITCEVSLFERLITRYVPQVDEVDKVDKAQGHPDKTRAIPAIPPEDDKSTRERELSSGGVVACPPRPPCPPQTPPIVVAKSASFVDGEHTGKISKIERKTPAREEDPGFQKFKTGMKKRTCCLCDRSFPYDLTPYFNEGKSGYICVTCHMQGPPPEPQETGKADSQTKLEAGA